MLSSENTNLVKNKLSFWKQLSPEQQQLLLTNASEHHFKAGSRIHNGENDCIGVILIKSGGLRTYMVSEEGREITLFRLDPMDTCILSATCVLQLIQFDVTIEAETDCTVIVISSSAYAKIAAQNVYAELFSYKLAAERFSDVMWAIQELMFTSFDKRLAAFLLDESAKSSTQSVHMTHEQIARFLGSAREVVTRMLRTFADEEFVLLSRGEIKIINKKGLQALLH
jgi:CRP/FNR family transcriptional regulator